MDKDTRFRHTQGIQELLSAARRLLLAKASDDQGGAISFLHEHPFGLPMPEFENNFYFLGYPGMTDMSVNAFTECVVERINAPATVEIRMLRELHVGGTVYFEAVIGDNAFMCGGCSNDSGTGRRGAQQLSDVMDVLTALFGTEKEVVKITDADAEERVRVFESNIRNAM